MADNLHDQQFRHRMESEFATDPLVAGEGARIANALEYLAFQMGQINRKMDKLIAAIDPLASKD